MIAEFVMGTVGVVGMASGVSALFFWKKNGNGKHGLAPAPPEPEPQPRDWQTSKMHEALQPITLLSQQLGDLVTRMNHPVQVQPPWPEIVGELERVTKRVLVASKETKPEWASRIENDLAENDKRLERLASDLSENMVNGMATFYAQVSKDLAAAVDFPVLAEISERLEAIVDAIPEADPRPELTAELVRQLAELPVRVGRSVSDAISSSAKPAKPANAANPGSSKNHPPTPPRAPRNLPPMDPNELPATPSIPAPYVPGTIDVPAGQVWSLLYLIQKQLSPNCPGSSVEFALSSDDDILVGGASSIGGPLSETNYAYKLTATGEPRIYRATYPGGNTPVGELQVLAPAGGTLHVEVQS